MKYLKSLTLKMCVIAAALLLASPAVAANSNGRGTKVKTVYQDTDPSATNYLKNRRALVGPGCTVNSVGDGVKVLSGVKNLQNICNDDLDDYAEFIGLADAAVAGAPVFSVKDNQHYYAGGMEAGFTICANSKSGLLSLDLASFFKIQFLKDGEEVGGLCDIENAKNVTGIGLSLITIPGSDLITKSFIAKAPGDFDEIKLVRLGVVADALATFNVKYAFVGSAREYTITNNKENGISKYATDFGRREIKLETKETSPSGIDPINGDNVINEDLKDSYDLIYNLLLEATPRPITVVSKPSDNKETFPAGTEVGFKYNSKSLLSVDVAGAVLITLYDKDGNKVGGPYNVSLSVLKLGLLEFNDGVEAVVKSPVPFSSAKIKLQGLKVLKLGAETVNYAFVRMAPDLATHHCPIEATASHNVCGCENEYQLQHSDKVSNITWSIVSQPDDSNISLDAQTGKVSNIYVPGDYTFMATAKDGCSETTTIHYAPYYSPAEHGVTLLVNNKNETEKYALSDNKGGSLIQIFGGTENANKILTSDLTDFASTKPDVEIATNTDIIGVKSVDGSNLAKNVATDHAMKVGFVVSSTATGLSADVLKFYNIQLLKNGNKVEGGVTTHWNGISAGLIGSEKTEKGRLSINVPAGTDFDEIVLYSSGLLGADLDKLNVYYAYVSDETMENTANNALYGAEIVSVDNTDASIDLAKTNFASVATIGSGLTNISNLIDNDMNTYMTFPLGVDLNGAAVMVNVGKIVNQQQNAGKATEEEQNKQGQKIVLATNQLTLGLGVDLIKVLKVSTYLDDAEEPQEVLTDWKVLGADVIGTGGKGYVSLVTTKPFNKLKIEQVNTVKVANTLQIGGIALTSNINEDGTSTDCPEEFLVLDEDETLDDERNLTKATMVFHRTFTRGEWNSLILPVDMTADQVTAAFGANAKIARFNRLEERWIYFLPVEPDADGNMLKANIPYIIKPTKEPTAVNRTYNVGGENTKHINGLVYTVTGIVYEGLPNLQQEDIKFTSGMTHYGSYTNPTVVPADSYILHRSGDMVHTAVEHPNIKSYRTWLRETTPSGETLQMRVEQNDGPSTGIKVIEETAKNANAVYNVNGMRMNSSNTNNLPKGVYIINNKKVVIK